MTPLWRHDACSSHLGTRERFTCWTRVSYLWLKKKRGGGEREKEASALGWIMDTQTLSHFAHIQTEGAAYSTFHLSFSVTDRTLSSLFPKSELHASMESYCRGLSNKKAQVYNWVIGETAVFEWQRGGVNIGSNKLDFIFEWFLTCAQNIVSTLVPLECKDGALVLPEGFF